MPKKIVNLREYRETQTLKKQINELDAMAELYITHEPDPVIRKGYKNFMKFLKALDAKYMDEGGGK